MFSTIAGRFVLLALLGSSKAPGAQQTIAELTAARERGVFNDTDALAFIVSADPADHGDDGLKDLTPGLRVFRDRDTAISRAYGVLSNQTGVYSPTIYLLDPLLRVVAVSPINRLPQLIAILERQPKPGRYQGEGAPAPVLTLPRILEVDYCRELIELYETKGGGESGFMQERDGKTVGAFDYSRKRRKDCTIEDPRQQGILRDRLMRRVVPEILKAYQFEITRIERYIVACYDGNDGGHFKAHRDNTTKGTHRRFAVSINLNDAFDGGEVWFPEFSDKRYRPPAGGCVVFSCSLLHEATPVTRGLRYATLPFLYDEKGAEIRRQNMVFLGGMQSPPPG